MLLFGKPSHYFLCKGASEGFSPLNAFDAALLAAGVGNTNLIRMSSILPPELLETGPVPLEPGSFVPLAYASITCTTPGQVIAAGIAVAIPQDKSLPGVIMEYEAHAGREEVESQVRNMAIEAMKHRNYAIKEVLSVAVEHKVEAIGAAFAALVLYKS